MKNKYKKKEKMLFLAIKMGCNENCKECKEKKKERKNKTTKEKKKTKRH